MEIQMANQKWKKWNEDSDEMYFYLGYSYNYDSTESLFILELDL